MEELTQKQTAEIVKEIQKYLMQNGGMKEQSYILSLDIIEILGAFLNKHSYKLAY